MMADVSAAQQMLGSTRSEGSVPLVPLEHMDYGYIGKCTNVKELEKIFKVLKSGKEGHYPDLLDFCEKRIADVAPKSKMLRKDIRPATEYDLGEEEWTKIKSEVKDWENDMTRKDKNMKTSQEETEQERLPPVRNRGTINTEGKKSSDSGKEWGKPSKERIKSSDYSSWDKFDAEAEAANVDDKGKNEDVKAAAEKLAKARSAGMKDVIETSGMSDRERELVANREKDKGNEAFRCSDYKEAIHYYSRSLSVVPSAPAFNNRSLARIKLSEYQGAIEDCTEVLELEPSNIKALLRRGTARKSLKYYDLALHDLQAVIQLEPINKQALDLVSDIESKMEKTPNDDEVKKNVSPESDKLLPNGDREQKPGGKRLVIEEIEGDESEEEEEEERTEKETGLAATEPDQEVTKELLVQTSQVGGQDTTAKGRDDRREERGSQSETDSGVSSKLGPSSSGGVNGESGETPPRSQVKEPAPALPGDILVLKDAGNDFFKKGQYGDAHERYSQAIIKLQKDRDVFPVPLAALYGNRASCSLRSGNTKACVADCGSALELNPVNIKMYMKRAQAYETMERYAYAYVDYKSAMNFDHFNTNAQNGASRMADILKYDHGSQWRDKLPCQPKSPASLMPVYTTPNWSPSTTTTSSGQPAPRTTPSLSPQPPDQGTNLAQKPPSVSATPLPSISTKPRGQQASSAAMPPVTNKKTSPPASTQPAAAASKKTEDKTKVLSKEERFQEFKAQGNEQVKKGEYSNAVGCYTCCIEVDPSQAVGYSNRALCFLKLDQPEAAIEDCSEALKRDPKGIKALYRRAQARKMLANYSESARDLTELLKIEPNNAPAKKELDLVKDAWRKELREKQNQAAQESSKTREREESKKKSKAGKRIHIQEVTESSDEEVGGASSKLASNTKAAGSRSHSQAEDKATAARASMEKDPKAGKENKPSIHTNGMPKSKRMTAYEFMQEWTSLKKKKNIEAHAALLRRVQPNDIPKVLSNKLDGDMLSKILSASANHLVEEDAEFTFQLLSKLRSVDRFKTMTMFLTKMDKDNMQRCINRISSKPEICKEEDLKKLKKAFNL